MVVLKNSALGLNFQFHDLAKNHTLFNGNVYPTKNFRHGLKNSTLITQAKCNSSPSGLRPSGLEFAFCFRDSGGIFQSITQIFVGFPQSHRIGIVENYKHTVKIGETNIDYNGKKFLQPFDRFFKKLVK